MPKSIGSPKQFLPVERYYVINWSGLCGILYLKSTLVGTLTQLRLTLLP